MVAMESSRPGSTTDELGWPPSSVSAKILAEPSVTLYVNRSVESRDAFKVLEESGILFRVVASRVKRPKAEFGSIIFRGVDEVRALVETLREMDRELIRETERSMPHVLQSRDPRLGHFMGDVLKQQLEEARAVMANLAPP